MSTTPKIIQIVHKSHLLLLMDQLDGCADSVSSISKGGGHEMLFWGSIKLIPPFLSHKLCDRVAGLYMDYTVNPDKIKDHHKFGFDDPLDSFKSMTRKIALNFYKSTGQSIDLEYVAAFKIKK